MLIAGAACATTGLALVTGSAQARTPKPKLYEIYICVTYEAPPGSGGYCGAGGSVQVFPRSKTATLEAEGPVPGSISTHKVGATRYTDFHFPLGADGGFEYNDGVKDSAGYSSQASPGTWSFTFEGGLWAEGTWWMVKI